MTRETKICQNCKQEFTIEPEDFLFYQKIEVPAPTFCPDCRLQRRLSLANIFHLYKRICDLCKKASISRYSPEKPYIVYCPKCWWSDKWDALSYGRDYDFSRPFFEQFDELFREAPILGLSVDVQSANASPFVNDTGYVKNCYLIFTATESENCMYGYFIARSKDCADSSFIQQCELSYDLFHCLKVYNGIDSGYTLLSNNAAFLWQCSNCQDCFLSANLKNKQYYIFNKPHTREAYEKKIKEYDLGSYKAYIKLKEEARKHWLKFPVKTFWQEFSQDVSGLFVFQSKNCKNCFEVTGAQDCKYASFLITPTIRDSYDYTSWGNNAELVYDSHCVGEGVRNIKFGEETGIGCYDSDYVKLVTGGASNLFGCVGIKKKSYCILNKQYTKTEYEKLEVKIIKHMNDMPYRDKAGRVYRYGEFFPIELSPFAYNETLAQQYYPLGESKTKQKGYQWKDLQISEYKVTLGAKDLPDHICDASDSLVRETIGCLSCPRAFKITLQELSLYRKMNVPLPRECFYCRLDEKLKDQPHPMRLYTRQCQCAGKRSINKIYENQTAHFHKDDLCTNEFETSYAQDRPEIVYCKECYQAEVA